MMSIISDIVNQWGLDFSIRVLFPYNKIVYVYFSFVKS